MEGDAADDETISKLVERAMEEEGRLDVFFANVSPASRAWLKRIKYEVTAPGWNRVWNRVHRRPLRRRVGADDACQYNLLFSSGEICRTCNEEGKSAAHNRVKRDLKEQGRNRTRAGALSSLHPLPVFGPAQVPCIVSRSFWVCFI